LKNLIYTLLSAIILLTLCCCENNNNGELTKLSNKKVVTLAVLHDSETISFTASEFNKNSPDIEIQVKAYMAKDAQDASNALTAFNIDLIAGKTPDMILISPAMSLDSYVNKGLFEDLYNFIDNDTDISREAFIPTVLSALETDGKLYDIAISFTVETVVGRTAVLDLEANKPWTWESFDALMKTKPEGTIPFSSERFPMTREDFFGHLFMLRISDFVDYGAGKCYFNSPEFTSILEAAKRYYPSDASYTVTPLDFRNGSPLLMPVNIGDFSPYRSTRYEAYFGGEFSFIGYPSLSGDKGSYFSFENRMAVSSKSENKDAAWEYLKYLLTDFQYNNESAGRMWGFPVNAAALGKLAESSIAEEEYTVSAIEGFEVRTPEERDIQKIYELIHSLSSYQASAVNIYPIAMEEAYDYFNGQKTAEEVAAVIQNRVSLYLAEKN